MWSVTVFTVVHKHKLLRSIFSSDFIWTNLLPQIAHFTLFRFYFCWKWASYRDLTESSKNNKKNISFFCGLSLIFICFEFIMFIWKFSVYSSFAGYSKNKFRTAKCGISIRYYVPTGKRSIYEQAFVESSKIF